MQQTCLNLPLYKRLGTYCHERFPLPSYGLMTVLFSVAGITLSSVLRHEHGFAAYLGTTAHHGLAPYPGITDYPSFAELFNWGNLTGASLTIFALFFQLRVADEHKDKDNDALYLPSRPVPRGLISLGELSLIAYMLAVMQLIICALAGPVVLTILFATWTYLFLMSHEFFCGGYLRERPILYMVTHMFIMLFCDLLITSFDFSRGAFDPRLLLFFVASFFNGIVIELGRKIFAPGLEVPGIASYSSLFGVKTASLLLLLASLISQTMVMLLLHQSWSAGLALVTFAAFDCCYFVALQKALQSGGAKVSTSLSKYANISVLVCYLSILIFKLVEAI